MSRLRNNTKLLHIRRHDGYDSILIFRWAACLCYGNWHFFCVDDVKWANLVLFASQHEDSARHVILTVYSEQPARSVMNYLCVAINDFWPLCHSVNPWRMDIRVSWLCPSQLLMALIVAAQSVQRLLWWCCVTEPYSLYNYYLPFWALRRRVQELCDLKVKVAILGPPSLMVLVVSQCGRKATLTNKWTNKRTSLFK